MESGTLLGGEGGGRHLAWWREGGGGELHLGRGKLARGEIECCVVTFDAMAGNLLYLYHVILL